MDPIIGLNLLHCLALYASRPFLALLAAQLGMQEFQIGLAVSLYSLIQVVIALPVGHWIVHWGIRKTIGLGCVSFLLGTLLLWGPFAGWSIGLAALCMGLGHSAVLQCGQQWSTGFALEETRAKAVGWLSFSTSLGAFIGPSIGGGLWDLLDGRLGFIGAVGCSLAALLLVKGLPAREMKSVAQCAKTQGRRLDGAMLREVCLSAVVFFATDILSVYLPLYGQEIGLQTRLSGILLSASGLAQMMIRPFLGKLCKRWTMQKVFCGCLLGSGCSMAALGMADRFTGLFVLCILTGCAIGLANPLTLLTVSRFADEAGRSRALALRVMANYGGQTMSPVLFGALAAVSGFGAVFWSSGIILLVCGVFASPALRKHRAV